MKRLALFVFLAVLLASAQVYAPTHAAFSTGGTWDVPNPYGATVTSWEEIPAGSPATVSVTIQGCARGGTCDTAADTNTATTAKIQNVTFSKPYSYFHVAVTLTGGTNPTMTINPYLVH